MTSLYTQNPMNSAICSGIFCSSFISTSPTQAISSLTIIYMSALDSTILLCLLYDYFQLLLLNLLIFSINKFMLQNSKNIKVQFKQVNPVGCLRCLVRMFIRGYLEVKSMQNELFYDFKLLISSLIKQFKQIYFMQVFLDFSVCTTTL